MQNFRWGSAKVTRMVSSSQSGHCPTSRLVRLIDHSHKFSQNHLP
jgi:hypothetical protein